MASTDSRPEKRAKVDYADTVEVLVGAKQTSFTVHTDTLTKRSPFFRAALAHNFKESREKRVKLPDCDRETFNTYLGCIYHEDESPLRLGDGEGNYKYYMRLTKLYILADRLRDVRACNDVVDHIKVGVITAPSAEMVKLVYDTFPETHKMRRLIIALCLDQCDKFWLPDNRDGLPAEFVFEYAVELAAYLDEVHPHFGEYHNQHVSSAEPCHWHEHDAEVPEAKCKSAAAAEDDE